MKKKNFTVLLAGLLWLAVTVVLNYIPAVGVYYNNIANATRYYTNLSLLPWHEFLILHIIDALRYGYTI